MKDRITKKEILDLMNKLEIKLKISKPKSKKGEEFLVNINAYLKDCKHWLKEKNYVLAFESIVWAWAWLEIAEELELIAN